MVIRLSIPGDANHSGPRPHPHYGDQLQNRGIANRVPPEGRAVVYYETIEVSYADGERQSLRKPRIEFHELNFGELGADTMVSARVAPALFGLGLLEVVPESTIIDLSKRKTQLNVSGRPNYVWDEEKQAVGVGRFGWKANQPRLRQQVASALLNDIGATSSVFPMDNCPPIQTLCRSDPTTTDCGGGQAGCTGTLLPEALPSRLDTITTYLQALPVPDGAAIRGRTAVEGERLFAKAQCPACHTPELITGTNATVPSHSNIAIRPYTDLLLHDMGEALADNRPDFAATGAEWRTAPLWGLGLLRAISGHTDLLHDGRARNIAEAILWHGGEAQASREAFRTMSKREREALISFVESL